MPFRIRFEPSAREIRVPAGTLLIEAARQAGLPISSACGAEAVCSRCGLQIISGVETLLPESERETRIKARNRVDPKLRLSCRVEVHADLVVGAPYW